MKRIFTFMFFVCFLIPELYAQISTYESPVSFHENIAQSLAGKKAELKTMSPLNMEQILQEDAEDWKNGVPPRFGFPLKADFDMGNSGT